MKVIHLCTLLMMMALPCLADAAPVQNQPLLEAKLQLQFGSGSTDLTLNDYHIKFIAEERLSDHVVQVVAKPSNPELKFRILNLIIDQMPADSKVTGPAAIVQGVLIIRTEKGYASKIIDKLPIQIKPVKEYSMSEESIKKAGHAYTKKAMPPSP